MLSPQNIIQILRSGNITYSNVDSYIKLLSALDNAKTIEFNSPVDSENIFMYFSQACHESIRKEFNFWEKEELINVLDFLKKVNPDAFECRGERNFIINRISYNTEEYNQLLLEYSSVENLSQKQKNILLSQVISANSFDCARILLERIKIETEDNKIFYDIVSKEMHSVLEKYYPSLMHAGKLTEELLDKNKKFRSKYNSMQAESYIHFLEEKFNKKKLKELNNITNKEIEEIRLKEYVMNIDTHYQDLNEAYRILKDHKNWNNLILKGGVTTFMIAADKNPGVINKLIRLKKSQEYLKMKDDKGNCVLDYYMNSESHGYITQSTFYWLEKNLSLNVDAFKFNAPSKAHLWSEYYTLINKYGVSCLLGHDKQKANEEILKLVREGNSKKIVNLSVYMQAASVEKLSALPDYLLGSLLVLFATAKLKKDIYLEKEKQILTMRPVIQCDEKEKEWIEEKFPDLASLFEKGQLNKELSSHKKNAQKRL